MLEYEKITDENLNETLETLFTEFKKASYTEREKLCKVIDKHILDLNKIDILSKNPIAVLKESKFLLFVRDSEGLRILEDTFEDEKNLLEKYPNAIIVNSENFKFSHFAYVKELGAILAHKFNLYINNNKLNIEPDNSVYLITEEKRFFALNFACPWNAISKSCMGSDLPDISINGLKPSNMASVFNDVFNQSIFWVGANKFFSVENITSLNNLERIKIKTEVKSGPKQDKIDELVKITLPAVDIEVPDDYIAVDKPYCKTFIQSYGDGKAVIRWVLKNKTTGNVLEGFRIYVDGKNLYPCKNNNSGKFVYTTISNFKMDNFTSCEMADFKEEDCDKTLLSYYSSIVKTIPTQYRSLIIFEFIKSPRVEQLFKMGFKTYFYNLLKEKEYELIKRFENDFMIENPKEKNIYKYIGFNKYQFLIIEDILSKSIEKGLIVVKLSKLMFENFLDVDNKTADAFFTMCNKTRLTEFGRYCDHYSLEVKQFAQNENANIRKNFFTSIQNVAKFDTYSMQTFFDYLRMLMVVEDVKFSIISDKEDLQTKHDNTQKLIKLKKNEYTYKAFVKQLEKANKWIFNDEEYCVISPKVPADLISEGNALHHCVGSFVDAVAGGRTNIVFIRKSSDINKSFFTAEISNDGVVRQIHGFGNSNVSSVKGLSDFVSKWAKDKKLNIKSINDIGGAY